MKTRSIYKSPEGERAIMELYDRVLDAWEFPCKKITVPTQFGNTFVIASGNVNNPPLVLLHGSGSNSLTWLGDIPEYSKSYRVYAVDILGEAGKSEHNRPSWDSPAYAQWLNDVLDGLKIEKVILVGLSLGGWTALKYTISKPQRVSAIVLISPGGICPSRFLVNVRLIFLTFCGKWGQARIKKLIFGDQPITVDAELAFNLLNKHYNYRMGNPPLFSDKELKSVTIPMLFLGAMNDVFYHTGKAVDRLEKVIPHISIKIFTDKGHGLINTAASIVPFLHSTL